MKKILASFFILCFIHSFASAVEFDSSIDASIRENYNVESNNLPPLPSSVPTVNPVRYEIETPAYNPTGKTYTLKSGTKINLVSQSNITQWLAKGSKVSFACQEGFLTKEGAVIPSGTIFKGIVTDSHRPQMTGNGGLIELKIDEIYYNGVKSKINTKVSMANSKKIFLGNIKGKRSFWKNCAKVSKPGQKVFSATRTASSAMFYIPFVNLASWVPITAGSVVYVANMAISPFVSTFMTGGNISLPVGTEFEIKLTEEAQIKG